MIIKGIDFWEYWNARTEQQTQALKYYERVCRDPIEKDEIGAHADCDDRRRTANRQPALFALYDTLEDIKLCGRRGCEEMLGGFSTSILKITGACIVIYAIICLLGLCHLRTLSVRSHAELYGGFGGYGNQMYEPQYRKKAQ
jgi:hypothetical protein